MAFQKKKEKKEVPIEVEMTEETIAEALIAERDHWRYHKDFEPKIFRKGDPIPPGWVNSPKGIIGKHWTADETTGKWAKIEVVEG